MIPPVESEREAIMQQTFSMQTRRCASLIHQLDGAFFQYACAHAAQNIIRADAIQHDIVYPGFRQKLPKEQTRRARSDDCDLSSHIVLPMQSSLFLGEPSGWQWIISAIYCTNRTLSEDNMSENCRS